MFTAGTFQPQITKLKLEIDRVHGTLTIRQKVSKIKTNTLATLTRDQIRKVDVIDLN